MEALWRTVGDGVSIDWREGVELGGLSCGSPRVVIWRFILSRPLFEGEWSN